MFVNMAFVTPALGKEEDMKKVMTDFKNSLMGSKGLLQVHVVKEVNGAGLLGISMWENEDSFNRGMQAIASDSSSVAKNRALQETPTIVRKFIEI